MNKKALILILSSIACMTIETSLAAAALPMQLSKFEEASADVQSEIIKHLDDDDLIRLASTSPGIRSIVQEEINKRPLLAWRMPKKRITLAGHTNEVNALAFSSDGSWLVSGSDDKSVIIWNVKNYKDKKRISGHTDSVLAVAISPDTKTIASSSQDKTVRLWNFENGTELMKFQHIDNFIPVTFSHDSKLFAFVSDNKVIIINLENPRDIKTEAIRSGLKQIAFSPDNNVLIAIKVSGYFATFAFNWGTNHVAQTNWDVAGGMAPNGRCNKKGPWAMAISDTNLCAIGADEILYVWDAKTGTFITKFEGHKKHIYAIAFSPDSQLIASGDVGGIIRLWSLKTHKQIAKFYSRKSIDALAFSPDGNTLAAGCGDGTIQLIIAK